MNYNKLSFIIIISSIALAIYSFLILPNLSICDINQTTNITNYCYVGFNSLLFPIIMMIIFFISRTVIIINNKRNKYKKIMLSFDRFVFISIAFFLILQILILLNIDIININFSIILTLIIASYFIFTGKFINSSEKYLFNNFKKLNKIHKNEGNSFISLGIVLLIISFDKVFSFITIILGIIMSIVYLFLVPEK